MSFKDLDIKISYASYGSDNIVDSFLVPALKQTKTYRRSVGFFSSSVFGPIIDGIVALSRNRGKIQLIASPQLSEDDVNAINIGYKKREEIISNAFDRDFITAIEELDDAKLQLLASLIANDTLDIRIAVTNGAGMYHDKLGILDDFDGNTIVFYGSPNETYNGYRDNYEKVRIIRSWKAADVEGIEDERQEFDALWSGTHPYVKSYDYTTSAHSNIVKIVERRAASPKSKNPIPIQLRDYQEAAIRAWTDNQYHGFYVMATGTGKTWTAIYSAVELMKRHPAMVVICAPYKHLVRQWSEDIIKAMPDATIIMVSSENHSWEQQMSQAIVRQRLKKDSQIVIISTITSFNRARLLGQINNMLEFGTEKIAKCRRAIKRSIMLSAKIREELDNSNVSSVQEYMQNRAKLFEHKSALLVQRVEIEHQIAESSESMHNAEAQLARVRSRLEEELKQASITDISAKSIVMLDRLQQILYRRQIEKVEAFFRVEIKTLMRKTQFIDDIHIDDNFNTHLYRKELIDAEKLQEVFATNSQEQVIDRKSVV